MRDGKWFKVGDISMQWLFGSPQHKVSRCDDCGRHVQPDQMRLRVDNGKGAERKRGKGKRHSYVCRRCAYDYTGEGNDQTS